MQMRCFLFFGSIAFVCFLFLLLFFAPTTRFLVVTSATFFTTLSASVCCLLPALAAHAERRSASFVSNAFLAACSEGVSRAGVFHFCPLGCTKPNAAELLASR
jgi:hypothetical protein